MYRSEPGAGAKPRENAKLEEPGEKEWNAAESDHRHHDQAHGPIGLLGIHGTLGKVVEKKTEIGLPEDQPAATGKGEHDADRERSRPGAVLEDPGDAGPDLSIDPEKGSMEGSPDHEIPGGSVPETTEQKGSIGGQGSTLRAVVRAPERKVEVLVYP